MVVVVVVVVEGVMVAVELGGTADFDRSGTADR